MSRCLWCPVAFLVSAALFVSQARGQTIEANPIQAEEPGLVSIDDATYVLWDVTALGLGPDVARSIDEMLRGELRRILGQRLIESDPYIDTETRRHVEICGSDTGCLAQVAGALGADRLITGTAATLGDAYGLNLKLVDARRGVALARAEASLTGQRGKMLEGIHNLVLELVAPTLLKGSLAIEAEMSGAEVYLDGKHVGTTPLAYPIDELTAGEHALKISSPLMEDYFEMVTIHHGKTSRVVVDARQIALLEAKLAAANLVPLHQRWWFWPAIGGAAALALGASAYAIWGGSETTTVPPEGSLGYVDVR